MRGYITCECFARLYLLTGSECIRSLGAYLEFISMDLSWNSIGIGSIRLSIFPLELFSSSLTLLPQLTAVLISPTLLRRSHLKQTQYTALFFFFCQWSWSMLMKAEKTIRLDGFCVWIIQEANELMERFFRVCLEGISCSIFIFKMQKVGAKLVEFFGQISRMSGEDKE